MERPMANYEFGITLGDFLSWEANSEWSRKVCKKVLASENINPGDVLYGDLVGGDFVVGKFTDERRDWSFRFIALSGSSADRDESILCLRRGAIVKGKNLNFEKIEGDNLIRTLKLLDFSMISFSDGFGENAFIPGEGDGTAGALSVPDDQFFDDEEDRDIFFGLNADRLESENEEYAPYCVCDERLQKYAGGKWQDITPMLKGEKGDRGETGATGAIGATGPRGEKGDDGDKGEPGEKGDKGNKGETGDDGEGVIGGGTAGQFLRKKSGIDFDMEWADANAVSGVSSVSGSMVDNTDLSNPIILSDDTKADIDTLADVALSGYDDLTDTPTLATVATSGTYNDLEDIPTFATVATSGSYDDLNDKPSIPQVPTLATVATSGSYNDLANKPDLSNFADKSRATFSAYKAASHMNIDFGTVGASGGAHIIFDFLFNENVSGVVYKHERITGQFYTQNNQDTPIQKTFFSVSGYNSTTKTVLKIYRTESDGKHHMLIMKSTSGFLSVMGTFATSGGGNFTVIYPSILGKYSDPTPGNPTVTTN
jgi:hypothetical protein